MKKSFKSIGIIVILLFLLICIVGHNKEYPDDVYVKMAEINENKTIIGLSEEEVVELLGEPRHKYTDIEYKENYSYDAGATFKKSLFKNNYGRKVYDLHIDFDAEGKVEYVYIIEIP